MPDSTLFWITSRSGRCWGVVNRVPSPVIAVSVCLNLVRMRASINAACGCVVCNDGRSSALDLLAAGSAIRLNENKAVFSCVFTYRNDALSIGTKIVRKLHGLRSVRIRPCSRTMFNRLPFARSTLARIVDDPKSPQDYTNLVAASEVLAQQLYRLGIAFLERLFVFSLRSESNCSHDYSAIGSPSTGSQCRTFP